MFLVMKKELKRYDIEVKYSPQSTKIIVCYKYGSETRVKVEIFKNMDLAWSEILFWEYY